MLASTQSFPDDPAVHAVVVRTRDATEQCGLEAALRLANAQVADLKEKLTGAAEKERKYLAAELHDDVQQILVGLCLNMAPSRRELVDQLPTDLVGGWIQIVQTAIDHLHALTVVLRKPLIDNQGLPGAMRSYVDNLPLGPNQKILFETDAKVGTLAPNVAIACFRIVQEALGNAIKHSGAKHLLVRLRSSVNRLTVSVRDDGVGFDVQDPRVHALDAGSIGLSSMRERAALAGGHFDIQSSIGHGTRIRASFPIEVSVRQV
jgi:signal transduction histidine kinase